MQEITFSREEHIKAVTRRRIKFVVEKGAMARLFKKGTNEGLQRAVCERLRFDRVKSFATRDDFDAWHSSVVADGCWAAFTDRGIEEVRWGHFAKLINIILYELVANNELVGDGEAKRLRQWLHVPIDQKVLGWLRSLQKGVRLPRKLVGMKGSDYRAIQQAMRDEADKRGIPAIWFEDAYAD
jgi:hypothetical protein